VGVLEAANYAIPGAVAEPQRVEHMVLCGSAYCRAPTFSGSPPPDCAVEGSRAAPRSGPPPVRAWPVPVGARARRGSPMNSAQNTFRRSINDG